MRNLSLLCLVLLCFIGAPEAASAQSISVEHGRGFIYWNLDWSIMAQKQVSFNLRYQNPSATNWSISNGFVIYSPDGAVWRQPVAVDTLTGVIPRSNWDLGWAGNVFPGIDRDTVGIMGLKLAAPGLPAGFNGVPYAITIGGVENANYGKHICVDTAWFRPAGSWKWSASSQTIYPAWGGPYCWDIQLYHCGEEMACLCCKWRTGNVNGDPEDLADISDLTTLVEFLFSGGSISDCRYEANVDASAQNVIDLSDLGRLIDFLFGGVELPECPYSVN